MHTLFISFCGQRPAKKRLPETGSLSKKQLGNTVGRGLRLLAVFLLELLNAACRIYKHLFAGKEGVAGGANLDFNHRVVLTVRPLNGFFGVERRAGHKLVIGAGIPENHVSILGVNAFFHLFYA